VNIEGDLKKTSLFELFTVLSDQRATGILTIASERGAKHIALAEGEITVLSEGIEERTRLGDLLVARGHLTEDKLREALEEQRKIDPAPRIGEMLLKKGHVKFDQIQETVKFQIEEEISDVFTWKEASFRFQEAESVQELASLLEKAAGDVESRALSLSIDPQALIVDAARRLTEWELIEERLPSQYLVFKLTPKADENFKKSSETTQRIMRLIREGRTLESIVKRTGMGRFECCKAVIRLIDDGRIVPYPGSELKALAGDHRFQGRFEEAIFIYRRLLEVTQIEDDRKELERGVEECTRALHRSRAGQERDEIGLGPSHKEAAAAYRRRRRIMQLLAAGVAVIIIAGAFSYYLSTQRKEPLAEVYFKANAETEKALAEGNFEQAIRTWHDFYQSLPDKEDTTGKASRERLARLVRLYNLHVEALFANAQQLEAKAKWAEAEAGYNAILKDFPHANQTDKVKEALEGLALKKEAQAQQLDLAQQRKILDDAKDLERARKYELAKAKFKQASESAQAGSEVRLEAEMGLNHLQEIVDRAHLNMSLAAQSLQSSQAEKAIGLYEAVQTEWPELPEAKAAGQQRETLRARQTQLQEGLNMALAAEARGAGSDAFTQYKRLRKDFPEFQAAVALDAKIAAYEARAQDAAKIVEKLKAAEAANRTGEVKALLDDLLQNYRSYLESVEVKVKVRATSVPPGATVTVNGEPLGVTPLTAAVPLERPLKIKFELSGYAPNERALERLSVKDLDLTATLERAALRVENLPGFPRAEPLLVGGKLYVPAGRQLVALAPAAKEKLWTSRELVDDAAIKDAGPDAAAPFGQESGWWDLLAPPVAYGPDALVVARSRSVLSIKLADGAVSELLQLPAVPVGAVFMETFSGRPLVVAACLDGQVRAYEIASPKKPRWEVAVAPGGGDHALGGPFSAGAGAVAAFSKGGIVTAWNLTDGQQRWTLDLKSGLAGFARDEARDDSGVCLVLTDKGGMILVDLAHGKKLWAYAPIEPTQRMASATLAGKEIYAVTVEGVLKRFPREATGAPEAVWEMRLDAAGPAPLPVAGTIFAPSNSGYIFAIDPKDGRVKYRFKIDGTPLRIVADGKLLYVFSDRQTVTVFAAE